MGILIDTLECPLFGRRLIAMTSEQNSASTRYRDQLRRYDGRGREIAAYWLSFVLVTFGALVMIVPFVFMVLTSFKTQADIIAIPAVWLPSQLTLDNFVQVWNRTHLLRSLINTAYIAVVITAATVFSSSLMGFVFSKYEFRGRDVIFTISLAGMMLPFYVISIPLYLMIITLGWVNSYAALIVPSLYNSFGVFMMRQFMFSIPSELLDSARLDGCSEFRIFWSIALPLAKSAAGALSLLNLMVLLELVLLAADRAQFGGKVHDFPDTDQVHGALLDRVRPAYGGVVSGSYTDRNNLPLSAALLCRRHRDDRHEGIEK